MSDRWYVIAIVVAYIAAGAVLGLACAVLLNAADQINQIDTTNLCRRI